MERYQKRGIAPPRPKVKVGNYLIDWLYEMGPLVGGRLKPDSEILAYFQGIGVELEPWEFRAIRGMASAYLNGLTTGRDKFSIPPMERTEL